MKKMIQYAMAGFFAMFLMGSVSAQTSNYITDAQNNMLINNEAYIQDETSVNTDASPNDLYTEYYQLSPEELEVRRRMGDEVAIAMSGNNNPLGQKELSIQASANYPGADRVIMYPNPAINYTNIVLPNIASNPVHAYVTDMQGAVITHHIFAPGGNQIGLDVTTLRNGDYNVRVQEEGRQVYFTRLVKQ